ncbi:MocR-like pyridoxine biosynthesis transcription factor PdxR [Catellatospora citrea]|uniref:GntR family transcriptional regulator n=1 Tax=Catellatospora citrea TaxID=53366 RepID=A0A8J3K349_9ACTN|nr:PLP-dependent aminotransferase family protein [Catellatospora citrea]RKE12858.1 GntR family transcriptional regulator/MocR family aminotransferase [Catellatospora citrea]GIF95901.1 GntR family transcriptional regulator [Catellatospora citrea]
MAVREALVDLDRARPGVGERLTGALREAIAGRRIPPGARLPSSRDLAADLGVSRGLVVSAYEQLVAEGRLVSRRGSGTVVAPEAAEVADHGHPSPAPAPAGVAPLRPGVPDLGMFPRAAWRRAYERALSSALDTDLDYTDPAGVPRLRAELASYLGRVRAARAGADAVVVTTGAAQALSLLGRVLAARGMVEVGVEDPGSAGIRDHLLAHGLRLRPVPVDDRGLVVSALGAVRAVFVTPAHQFPVGAVLAPDRRAELIAWARRTGGLVIEDDYDAEFRYDREPVGCLQGLAPDVVALVGSASKALAPGLRRGWLVPPPAWLGAVRQAKCDADMGGSALEQLAFAELLASGGYDRHLRRARRAQRTRRDALVEALRRHLPQVRVSGIAAGLHLVAELPAGVDDRALAARARAAGLGPLALSDLRLGTTGPPGLVLGYAARSPDELSAAVAALARLL